MPLWMLVWKTTVSPWLASDIDCLQKAGVAGRTIVEAMAYNAEKVAECAQIFVDINWEHDSMMAMNLGHWKQGATDPDGGAMSDENAQF